MKECKEYAALLDLYVDGELSGEEMAAVQAHLDQCPGCRAYVDQVLAIRTAFPDVEETPVPEDFAKRVMEAVHASAPAPRRNVRRWLKVLAPLAACIAVVALVAPFPTSNTALTQTARYEETAGTDTILSDREEQAAQEQETSQKENSEMTESGQDETSAPTAEAPFEGDVIDIAPQEATPELSPVEKIAPGEEDAAMGTQTLMVPTQGESGESTPQEAAQSSVTAARTQEENVPLADAAQEDSPTAFVSTEQSGTEEGWVAHGNVVFARVAFLTEEEAGDALEGFAGKPYSDAQLPGEGVIGTGYAVEQSDFERIVQAAGGSVSSDADPERTTEQCCIVVLSPDTDQNDS